MGAVETVDRQELHEVDAELHQVVQLPGGGLQRSLRGEGAQVELVDDRPLQLPALPLPVLPLVGCGVEGAGQRVDAVRLPP
ncbi:hypothetical protein AHiyo6_27610 [Arthrobacter sp. Hiyo6]|nr:hypothetical protein AHiyo6_27610 [Arthrobacter sp. Hiyo6]